MGVFIMKTCTRCKEEKPFSEFAKDRHNKSGYVTRCKSCITKVQQKYNKGTKHNVQQKSHLGVVQSAEFTRISKLFTNGQVTVKALAKVNGSLIKVSWPFHSRDEADRCVDEMYDNPVKMASRYLMLFSK